MDVKHQPELEEKLALEHVEGDVTTRDAVLQETLKQAESPWKVLLQNFKAICVILAVQVSIIDSLDQSYTSQRRLILHCYLQSNAIVVGIEFSLPGNLLGIQAFCKEFGYYSESERKYQVSGTTGLDPDLQLIHCCSPVS
jgi:hypothetical protein